MASRKDSNFCKAIHSHEWPTMVHMDYVFGVSMGVCGALLQIN